MLATEINLMDLNGVPLAALAAATRTIPPVSGSQLNEVRKTSFSNFGHVIGFAEFGPGSNATTKEREPSHLNNERVRRFFMDVSAWHRSLGELSGGRWV